jgi:cation diffusion facilitator CzcD-associated flavoprotein CzcO
MPEFAGVEDYRGELVHPQHWPEDLEYAGKRIVVIGSGATAVTLVPALAEQAASVTMLQRSPTYIVSLPAKDALADALRAKLPAKLAYSIIRWKNVLVTMGVFQLSRRAPSLMKRLLRKGVAGQLPPGYDIDTHFKPRYDPWDERLCLVPDGDFFKAIRAGRAHVVTDHIDRFTEKGLRLRSGTELAADIVVTATGLNLQAIGGMRLIVDGTPVDLADTVAYKGLMLSGVPNFALTLGYTNASWTLKADLIGQYLCRLFKRMDARGEQVVIPEGPGPDAPLAPFLDLKSGYIRRSIALLPKQGPAAPWRAYQNYLRDRLLLHRGPVDDHLRFLRVPPVTLPVDTEAAAERASA